MGGEGKGRTSSLELPKEGELPMKPARQMSGNDYQKETIPKRKLLGRKLLDYLHKITRYRKKKRTE